MKISQNEWVSAEHVEDDKKQQIKCIVNVIKGDIQWKIVLVCH